MTPASTIEPTTRTEPSTLPSGIRRRTILRLAAGVGLLAFGGLAYRSIEQGVVAGPRGGAYELWRTWRPDGSAAPEALVGAAILAANPHNTQPWLFSLGADGIDVFGDMSRHSAPMDPAAREFSVGLGCAVENLALAARAAGYSGAVTLLPDANNPLYAARLDLARSAAGSSLLYEAIGKRHVNRGPYRLDRPVSADRLATIERLAADDSVGIRWFSSADERQRFGAVTLAATQAFVADVEQSEAAFAWFRTSPADVEQHRDGLTLDTQGMSPAMLALAKLLPPASREQGDQFWVSNTRDVHLASTPLFGMLMVDDAGPLNWLRVGRVWQRIQLWATGHDLAMQPLDQSLQRAEREHILGLRPEIGDAIADLVGARPGSAALPFRLGYPLQAPAQSPRRAVTSMLLEGDRGA